MQIKVFFARFLNTPEKVLSPSTWEEKNGMISYPIRK
jgi:hypothetical protein